ncbi:hypothetical protein [Actinopolymorpha alba]|uniref:hypothetical protein n=1 Tax=Actinopolymorpha alba TaxID=533267 RepID=UPI00036F7994|nr:hypothetical protein [Actinopolymorpha alba]
MINTAVSTRAAVLSERAWAEIVATAMGLEEPADIDRVQNVLAEAGVTAGRPPTQEHHLKVKGIYFAGIKVLRGCPSEDGGGEPGAADDAADAQVTTVPFSFLHTFGPGFTAFATDGINDAGKSTILGVLLWAIRGSAPNPTLQGDIRDSWLREAVVTLDIDGTTILIHWLIDDGRPEGGIYTVAGDVDLAQLRAAGLWTATQEWEAANHPPGNTDDAASINESAVIWPGQALVDDLHEAGGARILAKFENDGEFEEAVAGVMLPRMDLEPVKVWQKRPGAVDQHDATVVEHGWKTLALALAITDPTSGSVLGEQVYATQHLMSVFLGSTWSVPTVTARWQQRRAEQIVSGARRRVAEDQKARRENLDKLNDELAEAKVALDALGKVPAFLDVLAVTETASNDALAASAAQRAWLDAAVEYGEVERALDRAKQDLHALVEAAATKKFWHSLRPSCCPRCDKVIDNQQWAREQEGHCSLCDGEFIEVAIAPDVDEPPAVEDSEVDATEDNEDNEDNEDEIVAVRVQVAELEKQLATASALDESTKATYDQLREAAAASAAVLAQYDKAAAAERRQMEDRISVLIGRIEEREAIDASASDPNVAEHEFACSVFKAAGEYAVKQRDLEQHRTLKIVSEVITDLGAKFGVRNLISAKLGANGHLPVMKGVKTDKFSDLAPGERLRLRIALIVGLLRAGDQTGTGRHPGLLVVDDLTTQEINHENAAAMTRELVAIPGLQIITASTYASTLAEAAGDAGDVVTPPEGSDVMF